MTPARRPHFLSPAVAARAGAVALVVGPQRRLLAEAATLAGDSESRRRGLLGRDTLGPAEALIVAPTQAVHTFGMRFPIDLVFVDRQGRVLSVARDVPPRRVRGAWGAFAAIELPAGRCDVVGISPGDVVTAVLEFGRA
ncbi:MAG: DUF192 domain-containing protein [Vicinamibacterales bacterium]